MVNEAVAELKGEEPREPAEVKLDLPARRPPPRRLRRQGGPAARGLPAAGRGHDARPRSTTSAPSGSTATARCPSRRRQLLEVARLRAECHRLGVRELNVAKGPAFGGPALTARVSPLTLRTSQVMRLNRLFKGAVYKEDSGAGRAARPRVARPGRHAGRPPAPAGPAGRGLAPLGRERSDWAWSRHHIASWPRGSLPTGLRRSRCRARSPSEVSPAATPADHRRRRWARRRSRPTP